MENIGVSSTDQKDSKTENTSKEQIEMMKINEPEEYKRLMAFYDRGFDAAKVANYNLAIEIFTDALEILPNHYIVLNYRGICYQHILQIDKAIEDYSKICEIQPDYHLAYFNKGIVLS